MLTLNQFLILPSKKLVLATLGSVALSTIAAMTLVWVYRDYGVFAIGCGVMWIGTAWTLYFRWHAQYQRLEYSMSYSGKSGLIYLQTEGGVQDPYWKELNLSPKSVIWSHLCYLVLTDMNNRSFNVFVLPDSLQGVAWRQLIVVLRTEIIKNKALH